MRQRKNNSERFWKKKEVSEKEQKLTLAVDIILYIKNHKDFTKNC